MSTKPISPKDVPARNIPDEVISAFNDAIADHWNGRCSQFDQKEVVERIIKKFQGNGTEITREILFKLRYLDVEEIFRRNGWRVEYDKPAFNETYEAFFKFFPAESEAGK